MTDILTILEAHGWAELPHDDDEAERLAQEAEGG